MIGALLFWVFYPLEWLAVFCLANVGVWGLYRCLCCSCAFPMNESLVLSGLLASAVSYHRLVGETGCPRCYLPVGRTEVKRTMTDVEQRFYTCFVMRSEQEKRSWEERTVLEYGLYLVEYECRRCRHRWSGRERRGLGKRKYERELPYDEGGWDF